MYNDIFDDAIRGAISTNTAIKYASDPRGQDINYMARDFQCEPEFLTKQAKQTETHVRFACTFTGLDHPFLIDIQKGEINSCKRMTDQQYDALRLKNKIALTHNAPVKEALRATTQEPVVGEPSVALGETSRPEQSDKSPSQGTSGAIQKPALAPARQSHPPITDRPDPGEPSADWKP
jgi:hypothetical protein